MTLIRETSKLAIHRTVSADGTPIAARVHGKGPPLVLVPGGPVDGETAWRALLPYLTDHFTCYACDVRGRGLSGDAQDHSRARLVEDVVALVESVGDSVTLFGHSAGGTQALEAAARTSAVGAVALYEPTLTELANDDTRVRFAQAFTRLRDAVDEGSLASAATVFLEELAMVNDTERVVLSEGDVAQAMAPLVPVVLEESEQSGPPQLSSLSLLDLVTMPVLLLHGSRTSSFYTRVVEDLADRLVDCRVREIPVAGHLGPQIEPEPVATELSRLLDEAPATEQARAVDTRH